MSVIHEDVQKGGDDQGVLQIVSFLQDLPSSFLFAASTIPHVPLIPSDIDRSVRAARALGWRRSYEPFGDLRLLLQVQRAGEKLVIIIVRITHVTMQRKVINIAS